MHAGSVQSADDHVLGMCGGGKESVAEGHSILVLGVSNAAVWGVMMKVMYMPDVRAEQCMWTGEHCRPKISICLVNLRY